MEFRSPGAQELEADGSDTDTDLTIRPIVVEGTVSDSGADPDGMASSAAASSAASTSRRHRARGAARKP